MKELTYNQLIHHTFSDYREKIKSIYYSLLNEDKLSDAEKESLLSIVVIFSNQSDVKLHKLAYRIALLYGLKEKDFVPLYDLAINMGLMPVVSLLRSVEGILKRSKDTFFSNLIDGYVDTFKSNNITQTEQQLSLSNFFSETISKPATIIAPTSYGKSELIVSAISNAKLKNILVIVPSKSLLSQTRKRILDAKIDWVDRVLSHPEMYLDTMRHCVCVLTQERASRLLNKNKKLKFELVLVDEAHNILDKDGRNTLLASVIKVLEYRNPTLAIKYLTPFLEHPSSLNIKGSEIEVNSFKITESVKSENYYISDYRLNSNSSTYYDPFWNEFLVRPKNDNYIEYIKQKSARKNIVYFNRPKNIQKFAQELSLNLEPIYSDEIDSAIKEISKATHSDYLLIACMRYGVLYHHGSMTDQIRNYVEYLFRECDDVRYLITSSTLLEGVNLPVERLFLFEIKKGLRKLTPSQFKNLIGRVS
ncbi:DEAD/DEAH box helicase family protein [Vibrio fluvialis]